MNRRILVLAAAAVLSAAPTVAASWIAAGNKEPSSATYDTSDYMFADPNTGPTDQVYFSAFPIQSYPVNANVGSLDTRFQGHPTESYGALLGLWKDCNEDGYVGMADNGMSWYRSEVLSSDAVCPAGTSAHNDGEWVYEYIAFVMIDPCNWATDAEREEGSGHACAGFGGSDAFEQALHGKVFVNDTSVWGDSARPDEPGSPGGTCALTPVPQGTTAHTGLLLRYALCGFGTGRTITQTLGAAEGASGVETGLNWDYRNPQNEEDHPLIFPLPVTPYDSPYTEEQDGLLDQGSEEDRNPSFTTWDCSAQPTTVKDPTGGDLRHVGVDDPTGTVPTEVPDPTGGDLSEEGTIGLTEEDGHFAHTNLTDEEDNVVVVYQPAPAVHDPTGSYSDALNETYDGFEDCEPSNTDDRAPINNQAGTLDNPGSTSTAQSPGKTKTQWTFSCCTALLLNAFAGTGLDTVDGPVGDTLGDGPALGFVVWSANSVTIGNLPRAGEAREDLSFAPAEYTTFYAHVDPAQTAVRGWTLPGSAPSIYGAHQCTTIGPGAPQENGWECDPDLWNKNAVGQDAAVRYSNGLSLSMTVGQAYHMRDTDCFDQSVNGVVLGALQPCV